MGTALDDLVKNFNFKFIYELPQNLVLPDPFVVILEHHDHYSFQTKIPIDPKEFCDRAMEFFENQKKLTTA